MFTMRPYPVFGSWVVVANDGASSFSSGHALELRAQPPPVQDRAAPCLNSGEAEHRCQDEPGPRRRGLVRLVSDSAHTREKSCHRDGCQQPRHRHPLPRSWRHQLPAPPHVGDDCVAMREQAGNIHQGSIAPSRWSGAGWTRLGPTVGWSGFGSS